MGTMGRQLSTSGESDGIISRSMRFVFDKMKEIKQQYDVSIKVSRSQDCTCRNATMLTHILNQRQAPPI